MAVVMVVDDSQYTRRVHGRILESAGHQVLEAATGTQAIETFVLRSPALVLLDLTMADMGGLEVLAQLRQLDPDVRVVVVSADVQKSTEEMVRAAGAGAFVGKPADPQALLGAVEAGLAGR
jgi:two-component system, chemotaxis family, chemotaxis protein CheY